MSSDVVTITTSLMSDEVTLVVNELTDTIDVTVTEVVDEVVVTVNSSEGPAGAGVAAGGTTGQALVKDNNFDYQTQWVTLTKTLVGLANVDNTSDANKPVSVAQATANAAVLAAAIQRGNHTGTQSADTVVDGITNKVFTAADESRLANTSGTNTGDQDLSPYFSYNTWVGLAMGYSGVPSAPVSIAAGTVRTYSYGAQTRYRFIKTDGTLDAFYTGFDGSNLTGLVATKALTF